MKLKIKQIKSKKLKKNKRKHLIYKANKYKYDFQKYEVITSFGEIVYTDKINIGEAEIDKINLLNNLAEFNEKSRPRATEGKDKERNTLESANALYEGQELVLTAFRSGILPIKETKGKELKILTPKQVLQRLPTALKQVKAGNTSEDLLNEIR